MWIRKRLEIGFQDLLLGMILTLLPLSRRRLFRRLSRVLPFRQNQFFCLSVRTGFDLLLRALALPKGSEVLVPAITLPDMITILKSHGLIAMPVDLDMDTLSPKYESMEKAVSHRTRAMMIVHLFGGYVDMEPVAAFAHKHRLLVIEDCAQAFAGAEYGGHPESDAVMFSFGTIKTATALGGALLLIKSPLVFRRILDMHKAYPVQSKAAYLSRLTKYLFLKTLSYRPTFRLMISACRLLKADFDGLMRKAVRGFAGKDLFGQIRKMPCTGLQSMLLRRLIKFDHQFIKTRQANGAFLSGLLAPAVVQPGRSSLRNNYWVFPVMTHQPEMAALGLKKAGFDVSHQHALYAVPNDFYGQGKPVEAAREMINHLIFLPAYPDMRPEDLSELAGRVNSMTIDNRSL